MVRLAYADGSARADARKNTSGGQVEGGVTTNHVAKLHFGSLNLTPVSTDGDDEDPTVAIVLGTHQLFVGCDGAAKDGEFCDELTVNRRCGSALLLFAAASFAGAGGRCCGTLGLASHGQAAAQTQVRDWPGYSADSDGGGARRCSSARNVKKNPHSLPTPPPSPRLFVCVCVK